MKFGYCYECNTLIILEKDSIISIGRYGKCKCGNIEGYYVNDTDVMFYIKNHTTSKCIGIHSVLLAMLYKYHRDELNDYIMPFVKYLNKYNYEFKLDDKTKLVWNKPWTQAINYGTEPVEGGVDNYHKLTRYLFD